MQVDCVLFPHLVLSFFFLILEGTEWRCWSRLPPPPPQVQVSICLGVTFLTSSRRHTFHWLKRTLVRRPPVTFVATISQEAVVVWRPRSRTNSRTCVPVNVRRCSSGARFTNKAREAHSYGLLSSFACDDWTETSLPVPCRNCLRSLLLFCHWNYVLIFCLSLFCLYWRYNPWNYSL